MSKIITIALSKPKDQFLREASRLLTANNIDHQLTDAGGSFSAHGFAGVFRLVDDLAEIEITKKPMLVPWFVVESKIKSYFAWAGNAGD